jgi:carboxypeptidase Q
MRRLTAILLALAAVHAAAATEPPIAATILGQRHTLQYVRELTAIGPRITGSAALERAARWAAEQFRADGIEQVAVEPFAIPDAWQRERAAGRIVAPIEQTLHISALGWTSSTPEGGIVADLVSIGGTTAGELAASLPRVCGRIVLVAGDEAAGSADVVAQRHRALDAALRDAGALAILSPERGDGSAAADRDEAGRAEPRNVLSARDRAAGAAMGVLPAAQIGADDARTMWRLLDRGSVRVAIDLRNRVATGPVSVPNVIAEIRGRDRPDEWVMVGAHLDSWDVGPAAQDNATGVAIVLDAARAVAALGERPRRSIRFALWGGEEEGQLGSSA